jgi:protein-disulfide isomerase
VTNPRVGWLLAIALLLTVAPAAAQPGDDLKALRQEIETLKQGQSAIQKDLQDIKELLRSRPSAPLARPPAPPQDLALDLAGAPVKGAAAAKITMVEYTDYQ